MNFHHAYLHGFSSGPRSFKGTALAGKFARRGVELFLADLNVPSFSQLTWGGALAAFTDQANRAAGEDSVWRLIGSSMGGYLAARWANLHPERVDRLVLLCPGFWMAERWKTLLGEEALARWEREGTLDLPDATGKPTPVHFRLLEEAREHPAAPEVACPTLIVHGTRDEVVPIESSRDYASARENVRLLEVDDDHALAASMVLIADEAMRFFGVE